MSSPHSNNKSAEAQTVAHASSMPQEAETPWAAFVKESLKSTQCTNLIKAIKASPDISLEFIFNVVRYGRPPQIMLIEFEVALIEAVSSSADTAEMFMDNANALSKFVAPARMREITKIATKTRANAAIDPQKAG